MSNNYFLVTKPLQYFNCLNIETTGNRILVLIGTFYNSEQFFSKALESKLWDDLFFFELEIDAYKFLYQNVKIQDLFYLDSDYGLQTAKKLFLIKTKNIFVYEEGIGSYRNDLLSSNNYSIFKKKLLKFIGIKEHMGGTKFAKGIYLYDKIKHIEQVPNFANKRYSFKRSFEENILLFQKNLITPEMLAYYSELVKGKNVHLYLTSWKYNEKIQTLFNEVRKEFGSDVLLFIKPHPHIKDYKFNDIFDHTIPADLMIEVLLQVINDNALNLMVYHENSSSMQYLSFIKNKQI